MKSNFQLLNEGFSRMLKEAEEEYNASAEQSGETEEDFIDVGDLFTNGDETFKLLDVQVDEDGEVVVSAENNSTGESEEIEYVPKEEAEDDVIISDDDTEELVDEIEECLHRMNEAQMSPEDARDSEVLRNIYNKLQRRKNAKLTNDEHAILKKYGLNASDGEVYKAYGDGRSFANLVNSSIPTNKEYTSTSYRDIVNSDKINLADRARKISTRGSGYGPAKAARNGWYKNTLEAERAHLNQDMQEPVDDMKRALSRRNEYRDGLNSVDAKYDAEIANLNKRREQDKAYYQQNLDRRQGDVDYMLKIARQKSNDKRKQRANKVESFSDNVTKSDFIKAYKWAYGATTAEAQKAFKEFDEESKKEIVKGFNQNAKKSFLSDGLHRSNSKARRLKESFTKEDIERIILGAKTEKQVLDRLKKANVEFTLGDPEDYNYFNVRIPSDSGYIRIYKPHRSKEFTVQKFSPVKFTYSGIPTFFGGSLRGLKEGFVKLNDEPVEITFNEDDAPVFDWNGNTYYIDDFYKVRNNPWIEVIDCPEYIHACDMDWTHPLFIGLDDSGEYVDIYEQSKMDESCKRKRKGLKESDSSKKNWYGIPGIEFIWRGTQSDPLIKYNGQTINSTIVEDTMWERFNEDHPEICEKPVEIEWGTADYREWEDAMYDGFAEYMRQHAEDVKELFDMAADSDYYAECVRRNSKRRRGLKEARKSSRKKVTQKYLKDLIKSGKAENLNTWTDEQLNELQKKHYETIAVSFGINGMNGILLQDDDGKLYAVPSRSTTMFQMHKL